MLEYYLGTEHVCLNLPTLPFNTRVFGRNPDRTQLIFTGFFSGSTNGSWADSIILSFPTHGPIVTEEWWATYDGTNGILLSHNQFDVVNGHRVLAMTAKTPNTGPTFLGASLDATGYIYPD